jgi:CBS domain-containing protein
MTSKRRRTNARTDRGDRPPAAKPPSHEIHTSGISNRPADEERMRQERLPPRGPSDEPTWTRQVEGTEGGELMAKTVVDVMTSQPTALDAAASIPEAARAMRDGNIGDVLVTQDGRLVGILTDRDVVVRVLAEDRDPVNTTLGDVCSRDLTTLNPSDAIETAVTRMRESAVRRLPVVEEGRPVGILALGDLAVERDPESVLGEISAAPPTR